MGTYTCDSRLNTSDINLRGGQVGRRMRHVPDCFRVEEITEAFNIAVYEVIDPGRDIPLI